MLTVFTSLACYPGALLTWRPNLPFLGSPALPPSRLTGGIATPTRRYHGRMFINPSPPACATPRGERVLAHTQVRDPCESAAACYRHGDPILLAIDHLFLTSDFCYVPRRNFLQFFPPCPPLPLLQEFSQLEA